MTQHLRNEPNVLYAIFFTQKQEKAFYLFYQLMVQSGKVVGFCGIVCSDCLVLKSTRDDDDELRARVLREQGWKWADLFIEKFGREPHLKDIDCDGCLSEGRLFWYCLDCDWRACAMDKGLDNCAHCVDYPCESLSRLFDKHPRAKETLDGIRNKLERRGGVG
jgi:hypothetical protein